MAETTPTSTANLTPPRPVVDPVATAAASKAATDAGAKKIEDAKTREQRRRDAQNDLNAQAANVMENSTPTPTQEENDLAKLGALNHDEKKDPENPEMPPLHEQRARLAEADGDRAAYKTRDVKAKKPE